MAEEKYTAGQKRQNSDSSGPASKKAHMSDAEVQIKILIPAAAVGALIGKGGESMRNLKNESGCRVQMSKTQEVYHNTNERICLVKGKVASCMMVVQTILDRIKEKADNSGHTDPYDLKGIDRSKEVIYHNTNERICLVKGKVASCMMVVQTILDRIKEKADNSGHTDPYDLKGIDRSKEMKLIVPNTSAGMVIGKSGASIKEIRESTGASIQVYPKAGSEEAKVSPERVITVGAENIQVLLDAVSKVLEKVAADPLHAQTIDNPPKSGYSGPGDNSQYDYSRQQQSSNYGNLGQYPSNSNPVWQSQQSLVGDQGYMKQPQSGYTQGPKMNPMQGMGNNDLLAFLDNLQSTLRTSGFNEGSVSEIMAAMQVLAKYNIMGLGLGIGVATMAQMRQADQGMPQQPMMQQPPQQRYDMGPNPMMNAPVMGSLMDPNADRGDSNLVSGHTGGVLIDVMSQKKNGSAENFAASVIKEIRSEDGIMELEVPDVVCGAVLGPKAKTLVEIQQSTNCKVEVHKRGEGNVSAGCRLISLTGDRKSIMNGRLMIERVINIEQSRRNQNGRTNY
uniref:K Homology domain-containing protein n=1 Tax=Panagrolaimus sp. JU765 TaxID=591449 RepID=A0AC34QI19_9BILA